MSDQQKKNWLMRVSRAPKKGFTLPEVIVSFSVMVLVIVSATNVLTMVMRTNADNVDSMMAYGLAQEGLESYRFMRDSDTVLGLQFDGTPKGGSNARKVWGVPILDGLNGGTNNFVLIDKTPSGSSCDITNLPDCMPVELKSLSGSTADLSKADSTLVYLDKTGSVSNPFQYFQTGAQPNPTGSVTETKFHRLLVVQPLQTPAGLTETVRVSSMVFWTDGNVLDKKVVLTTELTDWK